MEEKPSEHPVTLPTFLGANRVSGLTGLGGRPWRGWAIQVGDPPKNESERPGEHGCPWAEGGLPRQPARNVRTG